MSLAEDSLGDVLQKPGEMLGSGWEYSVLDISWNGPGKGLMNTRISSDSKAIEKDL